MIFDLNKPFARDGAVDEDDVRTMKKALNALGYYRPFEKTGITSIPDAQIFDALKSFQKDQGLKPTGSAKPGGDTLDALNGETEKKKKARYIWRTVGDEKVRPEHAALEGEERSFSEYPNPGDEPNCRCWAIPVTDAEEPEKHEQEQDCKQLNIDLQNARLQLRENLEAVLKENRQAQNLRKQQDTAWEKLKEKIREAGFDIGTSIMPSLDGKIPVIEPILEVAKNGAEIWTAYNLYLKLQNELKQTIENQKWFTKRAEEKEQEIILLVAQMEASGCAQ